MNVPGIVQSTLEGEEVAARVSLGGEDEIFVTPSRTVVYRADGLLSNESIEEYAHDADRLTISEGRRKARFSLEYALDGTEEFTVPADRVDDVLHPVLAGVLNGNGITDPGESVQRTYRFSELTLIITSHRLVKHVGGPVWDGDYESYHYDDVTNLSFEDGSVATTIVLEVDGRQQRIKAPNEDATEVGERLKRALFAHHDVDSLEELNDVLGPDDDPEDARDDPSAAFGDGIDPLDADPPESPASEVDDATDPLADGSRSHAPPSTDATGSESAAGVAGETGRGATGSGEAGSADSDETDREATAESGGAAEGGRNASDDSSTAGSGVDSDATPAEANRSAGPESDSTAESAVDSAGGPAGDSPDGLSRGPAVDDREPSPADDPSSDDRDSSDSFEGSDFEPATSNAEAELIERIDALEATVEKQTVLLERQQETIETLIEELRQGR